MGQAVLRTSKQAVQTMYAWHVLGMTTRRLEQSTADYDLYTSSTVLRLLILPVINCDIAHTHATCRSSDKQNYAVQDILVFCDYKTDLFSDPARHNSLMNRITWPVNNLLQLTQTRVLQTLIRRPHDAIIIHYPHRIPLRRNYKFTIRHTGAGNCHKN